MSDREATPPHLNLSCFARSYPEARALFLLATTQAGGSAHTYLHPTACGPDGGSLTVDVAVFGADEASRALLILSGTHGAEGYAGSAAQIALMRTGALRCLPADTRVVLVHGINPYGFAHATRTTENNVDLNRNFVDFTRSLPANPGYAELHRFLCPEEWSPEAQAAADRGIEEWIAANGKAAWLETIMKGQYDDATGLNYGGKAPEWSNQTLRSILARHLGSVSKLAFIDWHTGLGKPGEPFFLCFNERGGQDWQRACNWWGKERVENEEGFEGGARPSYNGLVFYGVRDAVAPARMTGAVIEFGTLPIKETFNQLRVDRWLKFGKTPADPKILEPLRQRIREAFVSSDEEWRIRVIDHAREIQLQALDGLARWS
jgi:hypothetical protein